MDDLWFRSRRLDQGLGYSIANWKGWLATAVFGFAVLVGLGVPWAVDGGGLLGFGIGAVFFILALAVYVGVIRKHSDWRG